MYESRMDVLRAAMEQSAVDMSCKPEDFCSGENILVRSLPGCNARKYLELPFLCNFVSYGNNIVASGSEEFLPIAREYMDAYPVEHCFETPNLLVLMEKLRPYHANVCFMAEYWLPDPAQLRPLPCALETRVLTSFDGLYNNLWSNALCADRRELDVLGVGAYDRGKLVGLAACSADCETMYQIGVDVLPEYRRRGIASSLTSTLAAEILNRGKLPFYCCAWSNIPSAGNAIRSGFFPAWVEMTVKGDSFIRRMNSSFEIPADAARRGTEEQFTENLPQSSESFIANGPGM